MRCCTLLQSASQASQTYLPLERVGGGERRPVCILDIGLCLVFEGNADTTPACEGLDSRISVGSPNGEGGVCGGVTEDTGVVSGHGEVGAQVSADSGSGSRGR